MSASSASSASAARSAAGEPPIIAPMLAGGSGRPAQPRLFQFEPKLDGERVVVRVWDDQLELRTRNGNVVTDAYPELAGLPTGFGGQALVLDGEVVAFDDAGRTDFQRLQARMHVRQPSPKLVAEVPVALAVFDLLWIDGESLVQLPQADRRRRLEALATRRAGWELIPVLAGDLEDLVAASAEVGLEGLVAKRLDAPYRPGQRSPAWVKIKFRHEREFVVGGWSEGEGRRRGRIGSLAIGYVDPSADPAALLEQPILRYVGQVGSGLGDKLLSELAEAFSRFAREESPFINTPPLPLHWVAPLLVVQVAFAEMTRAGTLRAPSLLGVRTDVAPETVGWDDELRPAGASS
jgi:bifunctional non-homologous end joining protein LigD